MSNSNVFLKKLLDHHKKHVFLSLKFKKIVFLLSVCPWAKNALFACPLSTSFQTNISWTCPFVPEPKIRLRDIPSYRMNLIPNETGFLKLIVELEWRNQVHQMHSAWKKNGSRGRFFYGVVFFTALIKNNFVLVFLLKSSILSPDSVPAWKFTSKTLLPRPF